MDDSEFKDVFPPDPVAGIRVSDGFSSRLGVEFFAEHTRKTSVESFAALLAMLNAVLAIEISALAKAAGSDVARHHGRMQLAMELRERASEFETRLERYRTRQRVNPRGTPQ